jgi:hypothetical protein
MFFKPIGEVRSPDDLADETTSIIGSGGEIKEQLSRLFPAIEWRDDHEHRSIRGSVDGPDTWYEFRLTEEPDKSFTVHTSHLARERRLIAEICRELGLVAFDGQACALIGVGSAGGVDCAEAKPIRR